MTDGAGNVKARRDYLPFGEEIPSTIGVRSSIAGYATTDATRQKFTSKERDSESGLDYFLARYYSAAQGRFTSPDPENAGVIPDDAQRWNGYAYARNSPIVYVDPDGMMYRLIDLNGNWADFRDDHINNTLKRDSSIVMRNGQIFQNGQLIGYYERLSFDDMGAMGNGFFKQMSARRSASLKIIGIFAAGTAAVGASGGLAAFYGPAAIPLLSAGAQKISVTGPSVAVTLMAKAQDPKLRNIINNLYRVTAKIGSGSSADAFRADGSHRQKLVDSIRGLENVLKNPRLSDTDRAIAEHLIKDMKNALSGK